MGNYLTIPSYWFGGEASSPEIRTESLDVEEDESETKSEFKTHLKSDSDVVQLVEWLGSQGVDVIKVEKMICDLWKKHEETLRSDAYESLQHVLKTQNSFAEMRSAIKNLVHERKIAIMTDIEDNIGSKKGSFHVNIDGIIRSISGVLGAAGAGPIGAIMVALLNGIKEVDFYVKECTTEGKRGQTLGIIDITWDEHDDDGDGTVLFEIAKLEVKMINKKKEAVFVGNKEVIVDISAYYAKASMHLRNFMTTDERKRLKSKLNKSMTKAK